MKKVFVITSLLGLSCINGLIAQDNVASENKETILSISKVDDSVVVKNGKNTISMGPTGGVVISKNDTAKSRKIVEFSFLNMDFGVNFLQDKTNYASQDAINFLQVPEAYRNETLFSLRQGKSWNYNLWPVITKFNLYRGSAQNIGLKTGIGFQIFNFKYTKPVHFVNDIAPRVVLRDDIVLEKNKLSVMYASIPLMFTGDTKMSEKVWLHYGFGIIGGMNISTWTKQKSTEFDGNNIKKNHDMFNTNRFQMSLQAEIGLTNMFTLFGTYQLNSLFKDGLVQQPISIGLRL